MAVFVLQHIHKFEDNDEDVKMIGVYSTQETTEQAVERMVLQPGFKDAPEGFCIDRYPLDQDQWPEGYVTWTGEN